MKLPCTKVDIFIISGATLTEKKAKKIRQYQKFYILLQSDIAIKAQKLQSALQKNGKQDG
jgi:hypothetical protein